MSNYNEDDDDMFDDEADMLPQAYYTTAEDNSPGIDAVLNHRLRADTGRSSNTSLPWLMAESETGTEITDPGRDDFEYYVRRT